MKTILLGLLQVNHDKTVGIGDKFPDDSHRFRDLFDALEIPGVRFRYRVYMTIGGEVPSDVDECDAYLITGSPLSVLDNLDWLPDLYDFIRKCDAAQKPLLGACFGHQAIAMALGGKVERASVGWNVGVETCVFQGQKPWMQPLQRELPLYVFHQDQVTQLPPNAQLLGSSNRCSNASFAIGDHIFTTQAHPEFSLRFMIAVVEYCRDYMGAEAYKAAKASMGQTQDGMLFAQWAANFFRQENAS